MKYAQIKNSIVQNVIVLDDDSLLPLFSEGFDLVLRVDQMMIYPGPGWTFDGSVFVPPVVIPELDT